MAEIAAIARPYAEAAFAVAGGDGLSRHPRSPLSGGGGGAGDGGGGGGVVGDGGVAGAGDGGVAARVDAWSAFLARAAAVVGDAQVAQLLHNPRADKNRVLALIADIAIGDGGLPRHPRSPHHRHPRSPLSGGGGGADAGGGDVGDGDADVGAGGHSDSGDGNAGAGDTVTTQRNLLKLLAANGRLSVLPAIYARFEHLRAAFDGTVDAELVTALPVGDAQQRAIAESLSCKLGRQVRLTAREDADLIGGAIVRAGDTVIDASVRGQLQQLRNTLSV